MVLLLPGKYCRTVGNIGPASHPVKPNLMN